MSYASSSTSKLWKYDVFLSFRGEDTRRNIVSHLYDALHRKGIRVFKDDERLETGKPISDELLKAIEESRSAIVIFSKSYASSKWCLEELAHIIKCQIDVIPIFYDVSPSDVRHQNTPFAASFSQHEKESNDDMEKVQRWREAFKLAGKISGYHLPNFKEQKRWKAYISQKVMRLKMMSIIARFSRRCRAYMYSELMKDFFYSDCAITYLPSSLRFIDWREYPSSSLPVNFEPSELVVLHLSRNMRLVELWPTPKNLDKLKYLDLSLSHELTKPPNFGDMPNLETLILRECENLEEVHPSIGHCRMLTSMDLSRCKKLRKLPKFVSMESLGTLNLYKCKSLQNLPKFCGDMCRLSTLYVGSPWIRSIPPSLSGLSYLDLHYSEDLESIPGTIKNLKSFWISGCNKLASLPNSLFESQQLEELHISYCSRLVELPQSLRVQKKLRWLVLRGCENLKKLPNSIQMESLEVLRIEDCPKFDIFPEINGDMHCLFLLALKSTGIRELSSSIGNLSGLTSLLLDGCKNLIRLPNSVCNLKNLGRLSLCSCKELEKLPENIGDLQELGELDASKTAISQPVPLSITKLGKLKLLYISHEQVQHSSSFILHQVSGLSSLKRLDLSFCNILGGLPEDLGSLHSLEHLIVRGSNISCLPKSINQLLCLKCLDVQFCRNLNDLSGELPPNLEKLYADYHLALKSIRDLLIRCVKLKRVSISWHDHVKNECEPVSTNQINLLEFIPLLLMTSIQAFHRKRHLCIFFSEDRISESFHYQFISQKFSINLNSSWHTDKFMGFSICCHIKGVDGDVKSRLVCKSDPERKHSLEYNIHHEYLLYFPCVMWFYIPFKTLWQASDIEEGKNRNDYCLFEVLNSQNATCWGIRLEYENKFSRCRRKQLEPSCTSSSHASAEHNVTERGLHLGCENKSSRGESSNNGSSKRHKSQNVEMI